MTYLARIVHDLETRFQIEIHGDYSSKEIIKSIRFVDKNDINISYLTPNILYLANYEGLQTHALYGNILFVGCKDQAPKQESLYIAEELDLYDVYNAISECLLASQQVQTHKDNLFQILFSGKGLETLLQSAYKIINNPIVVCDSSYSVLASYPPVSDERNFEFKNSRLTLSPAKASNMSENNITDYIYHSVYPFVAQIEDYPFSWIFESIRISRAVVGYICIRCTERELDEDDLELVHALTQMISIQLQKGSDYMNPHGAKYDIFFKELFLRHYDDNEAVGKHLLFLGLKPKTYFYIVACSFLDPSYKLLSTHYYCQQLSSILSDSVTGVYGTHFVTLITTSKADYFDDSTLNRFTTFLNMNHMVATTSYIYENLLDSVFYFEQCTSQLAHQLVTYHESPLAYYKDHYVKHLIELSTHPENIVASVHPSIKFMLEYDTQNHTDYFSTLETYFNENRSAPATAKALFIHKSTLFYRFNKMTSLFQIDFDDKDSLFAYEYSIKVLRILGFA